MSKALLESLAKETEGLKKQGLFKEERIIVTPQSADIEVANRNEPVVNFCANNYLGLSNHPVLKEAAHKALDEWGFGLSSVRFICGTQDIHKKLEAKISGFLEMEDTILYSSCFDANAGLFETILGPEDAIISDELNHASIIDGVRLCKAQRYRYKNNDMKDLEEQLKAAKDARYRLIATDGVFSMDGIIANLEAVCDLADKYDALVMVDDSHATGFMGERGRGSIEHCGVMDRVDIVTSTLGKALGGASGGFTSGRKEIIGWLRQRSRPYLFSNSLAPAIAATTIAVLDMLEKDNSLVKKVHANTKYFREQMTEAGFDIIPGEHPITPVMIYDAPKAVAMADAMLTRGIYVVGFCYPVVPKDKARIRTQISAGHEREHLDKAIEAFKEVRNSF